MKIVIFEEDLPRLKKDTRVSKIHKQIKDNHHHHRCVIYFYVRCDKQPWERQESDYPKSFQEKQIVLVYRYI